MKLTRSQLVALIVLGVLTLVVYGCLVSTIVRNSQQVSEMLVPEVTTNVPSEAQAEEPIPSPTASPAPTPTLMPTPIPAAPQTRYDLQVTRDPENPTLRLQRGYAYIELGAYVYAIEDFDVAIDLEGTLAEAYLGRGEARFHFKEWSAALEDFDQALELNPDHLTPTPGVAFCSPCGEGTGRRLMPCIRPSRSMR